MNSSDYKSFHFGIDNKSNAPIRVLNATIDDNNYLGWENDRTQVGDKYYYNAPVAAYLPVDIAAGGAVHW